MFLLTLCKTANILYISREKNVCVYTNIPHFQTISTLFNNRIEEKTGEIGYDIQAHSNPLHPK